MTISKGSGGDSTNISLSPMVFYMLLGGSVLGGGGLYGLAAPGLEQSAFTTCLSNAEKSLSLAVQNRQEFVEFRQAFYERSSHFIDLSTFRAFEREQDRAHAQQDRRLERLENGNE